MVLRVLGLRKLPDVSTISRSLAQMDMQCGDNVQDLSRSLVVEGLKREQFARLTLDFDGAVQSTKGHAQGTAVGFNPKRKGARSYYPLFCTMAQTGRFFDMLHRPGNVHDSNGAVEFIDSCLQTVRAEFPNTALEPRLDSAFFDQRILPIFEACQAEFTISAPFERFTELKGMIENRRRWRRIDSQWSYFETDWKPKSWDAKYRFLFVRKKSKQQLKGSLGTQLWPAFSVTQERDPTEGAASLKCPAPGAFPTGCGNCRVSGGLQLDLFEPRDFHYDYKVIVTNKRRCAKAVVLFHNGRGSQEALIGDAKQDTALGLIPTRRLAGNRIFTLCAMMAHNLSREIQMLARPKRKRSLPKRPSAWTFQALDTLRHRILQRAGRLNRPQGELTLTMSANPAVPKDLLHFLDKIQNVA